MITEGMIGIAVMEQPLQFEMRLRSLLDAPGKDAADESGTPDAPPPPLNQNELSAAE
jgi:hypothetical protein